jgi:aminoglycoside phosphotransferase family enzyme
MKAVLTRHAPGLPEKIAFLSRPESYPERTAVVEVVETHMSCVFLTERHAWKLKKPVRLDYLDFSTLAARRADCEEELRLNRRLARDVYLETVPLALTPQGSLQLAGGGEPVEWLVKMRRLPRGSMLDQAIREATVGREEVARFTRVLADFYHRAEPIAIAPAQYLRRFERGIRENWEALRAPGYRLQQGALRSVFESQLAALERQREALECRARERRIVEAHGDLRPEHVCLRPEPLFIDCLEFNRDWRLLDPADELAYLAMECECAGTAWIGEAVFETYRAASGDDPAQALVRFYQAYRAGLRAKLAAWHLKEPLAAAAREKWLARARRYLELARA